MGLMGWQPSVAAWEEWESDHKAAAKPLLTEKEIAT